MKTPWDGWLALGRPPPYDSQQQEIANIREKEPKEPKDSERDTQLRSTRTFMVVEKGEVKQKDVNIIKHARASVRVNLKEEKEERNLKEDNLI